jgi:glutamate dehydrogenase
VARSVAARAAAGVPLPLAQQVAILEPLLGALDITEIAAATGRPIETSAAVYFDVGRRLGLPWLRDRIAGLPAQTHWQALARAAMRDDLAAIVSAVTTRAVGEGTALLGPKALIDQWLTRHAPALDRADRVLAELQALLAMDAAMLAVALRELRNLA